MKEKLQRVEERIASIRKEMKSEMNANQLKNHKVMLNFYMKRKLELEKQLEQ